MGVIIGDGHISNSTKSKIDKSKDYRIVIDLADKKYLYKLYNMIKEIVQTKSKPKLIRAKENKKERLYFQFRNKSFYYFLTEFMFIPKGNKSSLVFVPNRIKESSKEIKKYFLAGLFDTDGGIRGESIGFTSASKNLISEVSDILNEFSIIHSKEKWTNKKYQKEYYGIKIKSLQKDNFLNMLPIQNEEKLVRIKKQF